MHSRDGFDPRAVQPATSVFKQVTKQLGGDTADKQKPNLTDVASRLSRPDSKAGFRIIMDEDKSSILVSGTDGHIYLVDSKQNYDMTAPWGTIDINSQTVNLDVFGRIMSATPDRAQLVPILPYLGRWSHYAMALSVMEPSKVPSKDRAA